MKNEWKATILHLQQEIRHTWVGSRWPSWRSPHFAVLELCAKLLRGRLPGEVIRLRRVRRLVLGEAHNGWRTSGLPLNSYSSEIPPEISRLAGLVALHSWVSAWLEGTRQSPASPNVRRHSGEVDMTAVAYPSLSFSSVRLKILDLATCCHRVTRA